MGKNRSASGITNVIQYDNNGNIAFVSGSTTLMSVSSSGAITTTGVISGSNALSASFSLNSALLNGTGSVGFATTASLLTVSSSQQQISASQQQLSSSFLALTASFNAVSSSQQQISSSYIALSASYNVFSGSASTRITANSSSIQQVSSSQQQISASYIALSGSYNTFSGSASTRVTQIEQVYATTGSNSFRANQSITGSLVVSSTITAQTLIVQTVTSSIIYSSGSNLFGSALTDRQTFTGSLNVTGSTTLNGALTGTSATFNGDIAYNNVGNQNLIITSGAANNGRMYIYSAGNADIGFQASGSSWFLNKLGIGTNAPTYKLEISGSSGTFSFNPNQASAMIIRGSVTGNFDINNEGTSGAMRLYGTSIQLRTAATDPALTIASTGIACFACQVCAPNIQVTGQIARIDTIYLGGGLNGTGNTAAACYQIESAYALASCRTSVSRGSQYGGTSYYILLSAAQDVYVYYKLALIQSSYFCAWAKFTNAQDGTNRTGISQYSFDNGGTWSTLGSATFGAGSGTAGGGVATSSGNYSGVVVFRAALSNGSGNGSLIGIDQLHFMSCGYGMHFINNLG